MMQSSGMSRKHRVFATVESKKYSGLWLNRAGAFEAMQNHQSNPKFHS
jgi:hypothetical protein